MFLRPIQFARLSPRQKMAASLSGFGLFGNLGVEAGDPASATTVALNTTPQATTPQVTTPVRLTRGYIPTAVQTQRSPYWATRQGPVALPTQESRALQMTEETKSTLAQKEPAALVQKTPVVDDIPSYAKGEVVDQVDLSWFDTVKEEDGQPLEVPPSPTNIRPLPGGGVAVTSSALLARVPALPMPVVVGGALVGGYLLWKGMKGAAAAAVGAGLLYVLWNKAKASPKAAP